MPHKTLVEKLAETRALVARRDVSKRRLSYQKREALVQRDPSVAMMSYSNALGNLAERANKHLVRATKRITAGGNIHAVLSELEAQLLHAASSTKRSQLAAFKRTTDHARIQAQRILGVSIPKSLDQSAAEAFVQRQQALLAKAARAQVESLKSKILTSTTEEHALLRAEEGALVLRDRGRKIARNEVFKLAEREMASYAAQAGSVGGIYHTRRDEKVRKTHAQHDGKFFYFGQEPDTLQEVNCRCKMIPVIAGLEDK